MKTLRTALRTTARWCLFASPVVIVGLWIASVYFSVSVGIGPTEFGLDLGRAKTVLLVGDKDDVRLYRETCVEPRIKWRAIKWPAVGSLPAVGPGVSDLLDLLDWNLLSPIWGKGMYYRNIIWDPNVGSWKFITTDKVFVNEKGVATYTILIPFWIPLVMTAVPAAVIYRRRRRFRAPGICRACGYDLRSTFEPRCPECGRTITISPIAAAPTTRLNK